MEPVDKLVLHLVNGAVRGNTINMPKTTRMRAMRVLEKASFLIREDGMWRLTGKGYAYARMALGATPMYTDESPPQDFPLTGKTSRRKTRRS